LPEVETKQDDLTEKVPENDDKTKTDPETPPDQV
jgi:hypothetical protein